MKRSSLKWIALVSAVLFTHAGIDAADVVWIGDTGLWNAAANWMPAQVPSAADNAFITNNGTYTVSIPNGVDTTVASLKLGGGNGSQTLSLGRSTLTLNGPGTVNPSGQLLLTAANSTVTGIGNLTVNGTLNWASGTMSGPGVTSVGSSGVTTINGGVTLTTRTLNNAGHVSWDSGNFTAGSGAVINNLAGGTFDVTFDSRLNVAAAPATFNNFGLVRKTAGANIASLILPFHNSGTVQAQSGTLSFDAGGTHTGIFSNAPGAASNLGGGSHVLGAESFVTGAGILAISGNATLVNFNSLFDPGSTLNVTAGVATLASGGNVSGATVSVSGGVFNFNSAGSVGVVNLGAGTLGGTSPVNVTGLLTLSGGTITNALVIANGGLNIIGGVTLNGGKLVNPATAIWSAGNFTGANGAVFSNLFGATFINTFDGNAPSGAGATPTFVNAGLFQKTNGTAALGNTSIDFQFITTGTVEVRTNNLRYAINQQTAGLTLLNGGGLTAQAQPLQFLGGSLVGTGLITVANAQNVINSSAISPGLLLGKLDIAGNYQQTASGTLNIDLGGYGPGTTFDLVTVAAGGAGGVATLAGTLNLALIDGFSPTNGASFTFLTANSRVGAFTTFNYPSNEIGLQVSYDLTSARVTVSNVKPVIANPIISPPPVTYGSTFNFQFAANTFSDPDNNSLTYTVSGLPSGITFVGATRTFSGHPSQTGVFTITVTANDGGTPNLSTTNSFSITVSPATLTIAAQPQIKSYGAADPPMGFNVTGLQFADTAARVLTGALARAVGDTVTGSPYAITQGTLEANNNYLISFSGDALTITPAVLTVAAQPMSKTYGATDPALTFTYGGLQFNDTAATVLTGALTRTAGESVVGSPYAITRGTLAANLNYFISFTGSTLTITPATLTVTASARSKTYGSTLTLNGAMDFTSAGLLNSETIGSVTLTTSGSPSGTAAAAPTGSYTITPGAATGGTFNPANYAIVYAPSTLTVNKAAMTVTADPKTKTYGASDPAFTASYSGFVNNETSAVLGGTLAFVRVPGENVGSYLITPMGVTSANYTPIFNTGTLSITPPAPTILSLSGAGTANVLITWSAVSNGLYRVQSKSDLNMTNWTDVVGDVTANGSTASKTDIRGGTHQFYQVRVLP